MKNVFFAACGIALSLGCGLANAQVLDPNAYTSDGALSLGSGTYTLDTDALTFAGNSGVLSNGIAVFDFSSVNIGTNATVNVVGSHPLALLSQGDATIGTGSVFNLNGGGGGSGQLGSNPFPPDGAAGKAGPGGYYGGQGPSSGVGSGGGGSFGGSGSGRYGINGATYGNLLTKLEGGSGGEDGDTFYGAGVYASAGGGGGGGGVIEINTIGSLTLAGSLNANGGGGGLGGSGYGGGGAGGGILLVGNRIVLTSTGQVNTTGAFASVSNGIGGAGGGGRITIQTNDPNGFQSGGMLNVNGGQGSGYILNGGMGVITVNGRVTNTPAPGSLLVMAVGLAGGAMFLRRKRGGLSESE